jgi:hypothetical protein
MARAAALSSSRAAAAASSTSAHTPRGPHAASRCNPKHARTQLGRRAAESPRRVFGIGGHARHTAAPSRSVRHPRARRERRAHLEVAQQQHAPHAPHAARLALARGEALPHQLLLLLLLLLLLPPLACLVPRPQRAGQRGGAAPPQLARRGGGRGEVPATQPPQPHASRCFSATRGYRTRVAAGKQCQDTVVVLQTSRSNPAAALGLFPRWEAGGLTGLACCTHGVCCLANHPPRSRHTRGGGGGEGAHVARCSDVASNVTRRSTEPSGVARSPATVDHSPPRPATVRVDVLDCASDLDCRAPCTPPLRTATTSLRNQNVRGFGGSIGKGRRGFGGGGDELTRPFRDARRLPSAGL